MATANSRVPAVGLGHVKLTAKTGCSVYCSALMQGGKCDQQQIKVSNGKVCNGEVSTSDLSHLSAYQPISFIGKATRQKP